MVCLYHAARDVPSNAAIRALAQSAICIGRAGKNRLGSSTPTGIAPRRIAPIP